MSQLTALPRPTAKSTRLPKRPAATTSRPSLRVVQHQDAAEHSGVGFVMLCVFLLVGGLIALLLLNTSRAQQSFAIDKLQAKSANLTDQQQAISSQLDDLAAPQQLALRAQQLGLVPAKNVKYVRKADGKVLGVAKASGAQSAFTVGTLPSTPASRAADATTSAASLGLVITKPKPATKDPKAAATSDPKSDPKKAATAPTTSAKPSATSSAKPSAGTSKQAKQTTTTPKAAPTTGKAKASSKPTPKPTTTR
ncbi:hypothetical protein HJ588_10150 [Flexivirga sp. ID2601S]|uniref:Cell division protein FtsL n=1 Tax=Flexivirga aerilata TaxID=1656889 RepID=A0A849AJY8_9MICO|nr:hypothetical protein [Flexivirga aerilata]NNG39631.1 hypothetical protein [Flexivirga aerilata]